MKKFELTTDFITVLGIKLFRIRALVEFGTVKAGDLGGYVEKEENLDHYGDALVYGNADYACVKGFGTKYRNTTFFREKDGTVKVSCGCFFGTIPEFRKQVEKNRSGKIAKEYLMIADLMELHFSKDGESGND